jgi:diguanylate cyclase (GGDEF)-like protein
LQQAVAKARRDKTCMAVMFLDLDNFKPVNDNLGHDIGDLLLKQVARRLQGSVRASDTVARIGGDEFVVLLPSIEQDQDAIVVAEKILHALKQPFAVSGHDLNISGSLGIATYPEHGDDEKLLLINADIAMYHAKKEGRNDYRFFMRNMQTNDRGQMIMEK